jgi:sulfur-oxidizing protein SoxB
MQGRALLIDGGDTLQGSGPASWSQGEVVVGPQRALGVDLGIPGNWEVVYGAERLKTWSTSLGYPLLAANLTEAATGQPVFARYLVREVGGIRFGFVGFTDPDTGVRQSPAYSRGLRFLGVDALQPAIDELRARHRPEVVVLVTHVGLARSVELAKHVSGVDILLSGDTHERVYQPIIEHGIWVVEPGSFASFLGRLDVSVEPGRPLGLSWKLIELRADLFPEDAAVKASTDKALAPYRQRMNRVIGHTSIALERYGVLETSADDMLTDAIRRETGADIALSNGFRFAHPIEAGPVTEADLWQLYPVASRIKVGTVTGSQLRAFWESEIEHVFAEDPARLFGGWLPRVSGMRVEFDVKASAGQRVRRLLVDGQDVVDGRGYRVAACEREGDADDTLCRIPKAKDVRVLGRDIHDVVRAYLAKVPDAGAHLGRRIDASGLPDRVFSQYYRR